ncbi:GCN5 family acetyltransferase [Streptomyces alfalfae]|uniref:GCN5 family acetyltransferase n=1 Tax=Streptomyces alfalfae TaxID=1642299 RepID=A0A1P8TRR5_9ACTN|nr:GNAT family protein [Streptomyces alfalfae]APY90327.1 GCN5 family acetyltransferase [Streptomyces alfalfae]AYA20792.1 N-acetyltransferase [Streptomyces fradiae]QQC87154.1 GNAT family N-acetyltransferase [Streptomyces alfalfae]QUI29589.1 GNAT family N-acetyltransferase [Streptomyces alfalfae]
MSWDKLAGVELANDRVTLRRVRVTDTEAFAHIVYEPEIWRYFVQRIETPEDLHSFMESAIRDTLTGTRIVFAVIDNATGRIVGSTAYGNLAPADRRLEIGWSWLYAGARRTGVNRATKLALLDHAFDALGCERVEFKTDVLNEGARTGLAGIGAVEEGVLRSYNYMPGGRRRDVVYYSILRDEWPAVRKDRFQEAGAGT